MPRIIRTTVEERATPEGRDPTHGIERLQLWTGIDCDTEWFEIPEKGIAWQHEGVALQADRRGLIVAVGAADLRVRAVFRIESDGSLVRIESKLGEGEFVVLRDAFGLERLQLSEGTPRLAVHLSIGRYSIEARLGGGSTVAVQLAPRLRSTQIAAS
jgi:hypothetical protein